MCRKELMIFDILLWLFLHLLLVELEHGRVERGEAPDEKKDIKEELNYVASL